MTSEQEGTDGVEVDLRDRPTSVDSDGGSGRSGVKETSKTVEEELQSSSGSSSSSSSRGQKQEDGGASGAAAGSAGNAAVADSDAAADGEHVKDKPASASADAIDDGSNDASHGWFHRITDGASRRVARNPCIFLVGSLALSIGLSVVAFTAGDFSVAADNAGWQSRGTLIADRQTQFMLVDGFRSELFTASSDVWDDLRDNVQEGWENDDSISERRLSEEQDRPLHFHDSDSDSDIHLISLLAGHDDSDVLSDFSWSQFWKPRADYMTFLDSPNHNRPAGGRDRLLPASRLRRTQTDSLALSGRPVAGAGTSELCTQRQDWYFTQSTAAYRLAPVWKVTSNSHTALDADVILDMCNAEVATQQVLEQRNLCRVDPCSDDGSCYKPYGTVLYARLHFVDGLDMTCQQLSEAWRTSNFQAVTETQWKECVQDVLETYTNEDTYQFPSTCPIEFHPLLVNSDFPTTARVSYTSSIFATDEEHLDALYEIVDKFDRGSGTIEGAYDTQQESFGNKYADAAVSRDMTLAVGSAVITAAAILVHTRSPFLTGLGLLQIILSFPLAYFVYVFFAGLKFFPFLNFIGVFVVFALGADDIFVAVDKWKNARLMHPEASTEDIAAIAFPNAAEAMFLTTITTAIAFFGTAICPVAPIKMFAVFCGLLIMFDYLMNILLVFPALCIYDARIQQDRTNCCIVCCRGKNDEGDTEAAEIAEPTQDEGEEQSSLIHRILSSYYNILHTIRWPLLVACMIGLGISTYVASTLELPTSADVRLLSDKHQFERNYQFRLNLLSTELSRSGGSLASVVWGAEPADTGDLDDPKSWSQLVLDPRFDAAPMDAQTHLMKFCTSLFEEDFALLPESDFICPMSRFDAWLKEQSASAEPEDIYVEYCDGATSVPMSPGNFDVCIIAWSQSVLETNILAEGDKVKIITLPFTSRIRFDDPFDVLDDEWNLIESWFKTQNAAAPDSVSRAFFSSIDFWWYDTNSSMLTTAYGSAAIALTAAAIIIVLSSRSIVLTIFCTITIGYVLTSVTASLVGLGWTLGFLESICFAILIGVSVDFVIHFTHAYAILPGDTDKSQRTKYALIHMGPSILAAALTTISSAVVMLFTVIIFFQKFALILFMTVIQASVGSFVVFLTMTDCIGPSQPTYLADKASEALCSKKDDTEHAS